jgi:hypothetical protein
MPVTRKGCLGIRNRIVIDLTYGPGEGPISGKESKDLIPAYKILGSLFFVLFGPPCYDKGQIQEKGCL